MAGKTIHSILSHFVTLIIGKSSNASKNDTLDHYSRENGLKMLMFFVRYGNGGGDGSYDYHNASIASSGICECPSNSLFCRVEPST